MASAAEETLLDRMVNAVEKVRERLLRAASALDAAKVSYAVAGGNAVAAWVATVDAGAVRNTQDVDILVRRADIPAAANALHSAGFFHHQTGGIDMFLDGEHGGVRDAIHILPAGEKVRSDYPAALPDVAESRPTGTFQLVELEPLVRMKLTSFRRKDQVHLLDLLGVGLIDTTWPGRLPKELAERLRHLIDTRDD